MLRVSLVFLLLLYSQAFADSRPVMRITAPFEATLYPELVDMIRKAYAEIGYDMKIATLPAGRALKETQQSDRYDGELARFRNAQSLLTHHVRIEEAIVELSISTFAVGNVVNISQWEELKGYELCSVKGMLAIEAIIKPYQPTLVKNAEQCFDMMEKGRVNLTILPGLTTSRINEVTGDNKIKRGSSPINAVPLYHYLNQKHAALVPQLTLAIKHQKALLKTTQ